MSEIIGTQFQYKGKPYTVKSIESKGIVAKDCPNSPLVLLLPIKVYNEITGNNVIALPVVRITPEEYAEKEIVRRAEMVRYSNGENGRQMIDRYIADGYKTIVCHRIGAVNKYRLENESTGFGLPIGKDIRKYAELALKTQG